MTRNRERCQQQVARSWHVPVSRRAFMGALVAAGAAGLCGCGVPGGTRRESEPAGRDEGPLLPTIEDRSASDRLTLAMVGDVLVHEGVWMSGETDGGYTFDHLFSQVKPWIGGADVALVNQETILGGTAMGLSGYPLFNSPQELADAEAAAGFDVALSATNHALDQGFAGIQATCACWRDRAEDVLCCGIAANEEDARSIPMVARGDVRLAVLNYTESTNGIALPVEAPWCVQLLERDRVAADVERARAEGADLVVVCPHWGQEYQAEPNDLQHTWSQWLLEWGVDAVLGTHPHVLQPAEVLVREDGHRMAVYYSLGNFISWQARKDTMVGGMAELAFERDAGGMHLAQASLIPLVSHLALSPAMTTYPVADYTEALAAANAVRRESGAADFSLAWCHAHCGEVLGAGYDAASGVCTLAA